MGKNIAKKKELFNGIATLIDQAKNKVAVYLNMKTTLLYWNIGNFLLQELKQKNQIAYGKQILVTLSQDLIEQFGKGFTYTALTRMMKVAELFPEQKIATLSQQLNWSHLIELAHIQNKIEREFYTQMIVLEKWSVRKFRKNIDGMLFALARKI